MRSWIIPNLFLLLEAKKGKGSIKNHERLGILHQTQRFKAYNIITANYKMVMDDDVDALS